MKQRYLIFPVLFVLVSAILVMAQNPIPNAGFENWTNGQPDGWITSNSPGLVSPITQSSNSHSGSSAFRGETVNFFGVPYVPTAYAGNEIGGVFGFPISQRYGSLGGYYQFTPAGTNVAVITVVTYSIQGTDTVGMGAGSVVLGGTGSGYAPFSFPIEYVPGISGPDLAAISVTIGDTTTNGQINVGSVLYLDDLQFGAVTGINENKAPVAVSPELDQNYPNPFNPETNFRFKLTKEEQVKLSVYNLVGQEVAVVVNKRLGPGTHTVSWNAGSLTSGVYFYRLEAGHYSATRKLVLMK